MQIECYGTVKLNQPITAEAIDAVKAAISDECFCSYFGEGESEINFDELHDSEIESTLQEMIDALSPLGYTCSGKIRYFGDYDGYVYLNDGTAEQVDEEDVSLYEADPEELAEKLTEEGYIVISPEDWQKIKEAYNENLLTLAEMEATYENDEAVSEKPSESFEAGYKSALDFAFDSEILE